MFAQSRILGLLDLSQVRGIKSARADCARKKSIKAGEEQKNEAQPDRCARFLWVQNAAATSGYARLRDCFGRFRCRFGWLEV